MKQFEKGKLYQVKHWRAGWIIAEYVSRIEAHTAKGYRGSDGATSWHEPASHYWKYAGRDERFGIREKGIQVRSCTDEAIAVVEQLKANIATKREELKAAIRELREFCE